MVAGDAASHVTTTPDRRIAIVHTLASPCDPDRARVADALSVVRRAGAAFSQREVVVVGAGSFLEERRWGAQRRAVAWLFGQQLNSARGQPQPSMAG